MAVFILQRLESPEMNFQNFYRESIPVVAFFALISVALMFSPNGLKSLNIYGTSRQKKSNSQVTDMYILRPNSDEDSYDVMSTESSTTEMMRQRQKPERKVLTNAEAEIKTSLVVAKDLVAHGKLEKADKVLQHMVALHPNHPDVLTAYGQLLEEGYDDVVQAEHLYSKALISSPAHERAAERRKRTLPLVEEIDQRSFDRISSKQKQLREVPRSNQGLRRAKIEAYVQHIYHTNAMEGNTMTLMQTRAVVETGVAIGGKSIYEHNEILGMDAALQYINKTLLHQAQSINIRDILEIHKRVLGFVNIEEAGRFRHTQVFVGSHRPPPPTELDTLVTEFVEWLNSERDVEETLHPLELAALAHYKFVYIHPFYDGNGRVSRLLMNLILMQSGYPPVIINVEDKHEYYRTLQMANDGDIRPFIRFVADSTERTLDHYLAASLAMPGISIPGLVSRKSSHSWTFTTDRGNGGKTAGPKIVLHHQGVVGDEPSEEVVDSDSQRTDED